MKRFLLFTAFVLAFFGLSFSQSQDTASYPYWIEMMQDPNANFYSTQRAFNTYWDGRTVQKGDGFKPFKRWEWLMELEVNPDGTYPDRNTMEQEFRSFRNQYSVSNSGQTSGFVTQSVSGSWTNLGPIALPNNGTGQPNGMGRVNCVGLHPTDTAVIIVGASNGGIWRTEDHGQSWTSNSDTLISMQVSNIRFDPHHPNIVYAGTGDRDAGNRSQAGVLKSTDGGVSWQSANSGMGNRIVGMLAIDEFHPDTILAATNSGIYRTLNGAGSWTRVSSNTSHYKDIVYMPGNPQIAFATEGGRFYRSSDYGASWTRITSGIGSGTRGVIAVTPDDSLYVYFLLCQGSVFQGMYRSTDGGLNFTTRSTTPNIMDYSTTGSGNSGQAWYDLDVAADPNDKNTVYGAGINIFKSTDGGATWTINADWVGRGVDAIHADQHALEYSFDKQRLYAGCDGGIYYSQNGNNWTDLSDGVAISEVYKIGQAKYDPNAVICGYQDNGTAVYYGSNNWSTEIGGDGMECIVDPENGNYMYGALYYGAIRRSTNGGNSFGTIAGNGVNGINESGAWVTPYILHEGNPDVMFAGFRNLWRSTNVRAGSNSAVSWTKISNNLAGSNSSTLRVLEQSTANHNILFMARADRKLFLSTNINAASPSWTDLTSSLPQNAAIADIECHPFLDSVVYLIQNRDIYESTDLGQSWTNISGNLPNVSLRCMVYDMNSSEGIYVGGSPGIFYKDSSMTNWINFSDDFPTDVTVTELEIQYDTLVPALSLLRAATYGRGLWSSDLYDDGTNAPIAAFNISDPSTCVGNTVSLESRSAYMPTSQQWSISPARYTIVSGSLNSPTLTISLDTSTFYSVQLIATNGNGSDTAIDNYAIRAIDTATSVSCVTTTQYGSGYGIGIYSLKFGPYTFNSGGFDGQNSYRDYTCNGLMELDADSAYVLEVTTGGSNDEFADVYIDYNGDGDFTDANEQVISFPKLRRVHSDTVRTIVNPLFNRYLRLRVISDFWNINNNPCKGLGYGESEDYLVYFNFSDADLVATADTICTHDTIVFRADSVIGRIDSLIWNFGSGALPSTASGVGPHTVVYNNAGAYTASLKINDLTPKTRSILVSDYPHMTLFSRDSSLCENDSLTIIMRDTINNQAWCYYTWYRRGLVVPSVGDTIIARSAAQWFDDGAYQVIANNYGCRDTSDIVVQTVAPLPQSNILALSDSVQCFSGHEFSFVHTSSVSSGQVNGTWYLNASNSGISDTLNLQVSNPGLYQLELYDTTNAQCVDSSSISFEVLNSPVADFISDTALCFKDHNVNLADITSYEAGMRRIWDLGDGTTSSDSNLTHSFLQPGSYEVELIVELANQCSDTIKNQIVIHSSTSAMFSQNDSSFCLGTNELELTDMSPSVIGMQRDWEFGDGNSGSDSIQSHIYSSPGQYNIRLVLSTAAACNDTAYSSVVILPDPDPSFSYSNTAVATFEFVASDSMLTSYQWDFGDGVSDTSMITTHVYASNGQYVVMLQVSDSNACVDSSSQNIQIENVGSLEALGLDFMIYPNPSNGKFRIRNLSGTSSKLSLYNSNGKLVEIFELNSSQAEIAVEGISAGVYYLESDSNSGMRMKLIVQ